MRKTFPEIFLIARPQVAWDNLKAYLEKVGGVEWFESGKTIDQDGENLVEFAGRLCYKSWKPGLNKNITKIRTEQRDYFENILKSGHGSVLEHANYSFVFHNVSRVFTHELVRHRAGVAVSQESLRYVRLSDIGFRIPDSLFIGLDIEDRERMKTAVVSIVEQLETFQIESAKMLNLDGGDIPFHIKKEITSALRRLAPIGLSTDIVWTANIRTIRHCIEMRTAKGAEEEIRFVFDQVAKIMQSECKYLFTDYRRSEDGEYITDYRKV